MNNDIRLNSFPSNRSEALTMLYLKNQDLSSFSPEELVDKYKEVKKKIDKGFQGKVRFGTSVL